MKPKSRDRIQLYLQKHIKSPLRRKKVVSRLYNMLCFFERIRGKRIKKKPNIFDYSYIYKQKYFKCDEIYRGNSLYGISRAFKRFSGWKKPLKACIEHGVYFGRTIIPEETFESGLPGIIVFSNQRNEYLREVTNKPIIAVGPYLAYADDYLDDYTAFKDKYGKILLVFPTHSGEGVQADFDSSLFVKDIKAFKEFYGYNTVIVCMYYNDILLGRHTSYEKQGFKVVTAGRRDDPLFLSRLKSLIKMSDYTISNSVGTHVGYCSFLGKGHFIIKAEDLNYTGELADQAGIDEEWYKNKKEVENAFCEYHESLTKDQLEVADKYWGCNSVRNKNELYDIFYKLEKAFKISNKKEKEFGRVCKSIFADNYDACK